MPNGVNATALDMAAGLAASVSTVGAEDPHLQGADWQTAVVTSVQTDGLVGVGAIRARRLDSYLNPAVGDLIAISQNGAGNWIALGRLAPTVDNEWTAYTPVITGGGSATWAIRDGWYKQVGTDVHVEAYITASAIGSGGTGISISLPVAPYRGAASVRQFFGVYAGGIAAGTNSAIGGHCVGLIQPTEIGAQLDQVRGPTDIQIRGNNISGTSTFTINGWYRAV
ncbi:hypothetical protein AB0B51_34125 [Streptomyces griseus]|uniref:hypothetical protein n=1 Tax=Streptomyces griseus TaxID=1911 RepID=UPI0004CC663A|nr:hypothetical protein [Streptomyces griseus]